MKVILLQDIPKLGKAGEVKSVTDGYARNFLIPRGLVEAATDVTLKRLNQRQDESAAAQAKERASYEALAKKLQASPLRFILKMGEKDQAFGSISSQDIVEKLAEHGINVAKSWIELEQPIKTMGEHTIPFRFPHQISAEVKVIVEAETVNPKL